MGAGAGGVVWVVWGEWCECVVGWCECVVWVVCVRGVRGVGGVCVCVCVVAWCGWCGWVGVVALCGWCGCWYGWHGRAVGRVRRRGCRETEGLGVKNAGGLRAWKGVHCDQWVGGCVRSCGMSGCIQVDRPSARLANPSLSPVGMP